MNTNPQQCAQCGKFIVKNNGHYVIRIEEIKKPNYAYKDKQNVYYHRACYYKWLEDKNVLRGTIKN